MAARRVALAVALLAAPVLGWVALREHPAHAFVVGYLDLGIVVTAPWLALAALAWRRQSPRAQARAVAVVIGGMAVALAPVLAGGGCTLRGCLPGGESATFVRYDLATNTLAYSRACNTCVRHPNLALLVVGLVLLAGGLGARLATCRAGGSA